MHTTETLARMVLYSLDIATRKDLMTESGSFHPDTVEIAKVFIAEGFTLLHASCNGHDPEMSPLGKEAAIMYAKIRLSGGEPLADPTFQIVLRQVCRKISHTQLA